MCGSPFSFVGVVGMIAANEFDSSSHAKWMKRAPVRWTNSCAVACRSGRSSVRTSVKPVDLVIYTSST